MLTNDDLVTQVAARAPSYIDAGLRSQRVLDALRKTDRARYLPDASIEFFQTDQAALVRLAQVVLPHTEQTPQGYRFVSYPEVPSLANAASSVLSSINKLRVSIRHLAYEDMTLPIGCGQTCSEPSMVALIADALDLQPGMRALEIGGGCGYMAGVTRRLLRPKGHLTVVELEEDLATLCRSHLNANLEASLRSGVEVICADASAGYAKNAPYDRIFLSCGVKDRGISDVLRTQLKPDGLLLYPAEHVEDGSLIVQRYHDGKLSDEKLLGRGVIFVPLRGAYAGIQL